MNENLPALPESQSAVAVWVAKATVAKVARENFMMKCSARGIGQCWCEV
jgi:nitroreductase